MQQAGIKETLLKEAKEELGISNLRIGPLFDVAISNFNIHDREGAVLGGLLYVLYECKLPAGSKLKLSEEHSEYKWVSPNEAKELLSFMLPRDLLEKLATSL